LPAAPADFPRALWAGGGAAALLRLLQRSAGGRGQCAPRANIFKRLGFCVLAAIRG